MGLWFTRCCFKSISGWVKGFFFGFVEDLVLELVKCLFAVYLRLVRGLCKDDIQGLIFSFCLRLVGLGVV